ncbi:hypothetical protein Tco_0051100 [Tanacetum coccineum]
MVNPTIYTSCIKQFWATAKAKTVNREVQIQALVDGKKVIVTETSLRRALHLKEAEAVIYLAIKQTLNFSKYIFDNMVKNLEGGVKFLMYPRQGKDFSGRDTPLFPTMIFQAQEQEGEGSVMKQRKDTEVSQPSDPTEPMVDETENVESIPTHSNDPLLDRLKLNELMELCTSLSQRVLALETTKTNQALEIDSLKENKEA